MALNAELEIEEARLGQDDWTRIVSGLPGLSLMQTWEYAEAKAATGPWKAVRGLIRENNNVVGALQGILRPIPIVRGGLLWINRGPLMATETVRFNDVLAVIAHWANQRGWYVRVAPPLRPGVLAAESLLLTGFRRSGTGGWCSSTIDLTIELGELRRCLDQKWRNQLNKAVRVGLTVEADTTNESFRQHVAEYARTLKRKGFETTVTPEFLISLQAALPVDRKMVVFTARHEGQHVGSDLIAVYGETAEYCSGTIDERGRVLNAGNALLWAAITEMRRRGFRRFDLGGMHPERTPKGIFGFKEGLRGTPYCLEDEIETIGRDWRSALIRWRISASRRVQLQ